MLSKLSKLAFCVALLLGTIGVSPVTGFAASPQPSTTKATPQCGIEFEWQVTSVGSPTTSYGGWNFGSQGTNDGTANSTLTFSQTESYSNYVGGTVNVTDGVLSAAVGYDVTSGSQSTAAYTMTLQPGQTGTINWRDVYDKTDVQQEEFHKYICGGTWQPTGTYATAVTYKWIGFGYEGVLS